MREGPSLYAEFSWHVSLSEYTRLSLERCNAREKTRVQRRKKNSSNDSNRSKSSCSRSPCVSSRRDCEKAAVVAEVCFSAPPPHPPPSPSSNVSSLSLIRFTPTFAISFLSSYTASLPLTVVVIIVFFFFFFFSFLYSLLLCGFG